MKKVKRYTSMFIVIIIVGTLSGCNNTHTSFEKIENVAYSTKRELYNALLDTVRQFRDKKAYITNNIDRSKTDRHIETLKSNFELQLESVLEHSDVDTGFSDEQIVNTLYSVSTDNPNNHLLWFVEGQSRIDHDSGSIRDFSIVVNHNNYVISNDCFALYFLDELYHNDILLMIDTLVAERLSDVESLLKGRIQNLTLIESVIIELGTEDYVARLPSVQEALSLALDTQPRPTTTRTCVVSGCSRSGTISYKHFITGETEWYCRTHYDEMMDMMESLFGD